MVLAISVIVLGKQNGQSSGFKKGNSGIVELGYARGYGTGYLNFFKLNIIVDHRLNPCFSLGIGTGCRLYLPSSTSSTGWIAADGLHSVSLSSSIVIPLFADLRVNIINNKVTPYFSLGTGYSFAAEKTGKEFGGSPHSTSKDHYDLNGVQMGFYQGGFLLNPSLGVSFKVSGKCAVNVSLGYEMQRATVLSREEYSHYWLFAGVSWHGPMEVYSDNLSTLNSSRISINSGISF